MSITFDIVCFRLLRLGQGCKQEARPGFRKSSGIKGGLVQ